MSEVKRYEITGVRFNNQSGAYMYYTDHLSALSELQLAADGLRDALINANARGPFPMYTAALVAYAEKRGKG